MKKKVKKKVLWLEIIASVKIDNTSNSNEIGAKQFKRFQEIDIMLITFSKVLKFAFDSWNSFS